MNTKCWNLARWLLVLGMAAGGVSSARAEKVWMAGDSMMKLVARSLSRELAAVPGTETITEVSIGTGLARLDLHDWMAKARGVAAQKPGIAVVLMGANDNQPMKTADGTVVKPGTPEWTKEYTVRVTAFLDLLKAGGIRHTIWIGLPDLRDPKLQAETRPVNEIIRPYAAAHPAEITFRLLFRVLCISRCAWLRIRFLGSSHLCGRRGIAIHALIEHLGKLCIGERGIVAGVRNRVCFVCGCRHAVPPHIAVAALGLAIRRSPEGPLHLLWVQRAGAC